MERKTNNPLLVKSEIGRTKPFTTRLPHVDFVYGRPVDSSDDLDIELKKFSKNKFPTKKPGQE